MNVAFFSGVSGMIAYQQDMDALSHNIANVNTTGFKPSKSNFSDLLYTRMDVNSEGDTPLVGHGVRVSDLRLFCRQGILSDTGNPLDFALLGEGFFAVERDGQIQYTRNGAFDISLEGSRSVLVSKDGGYVLDARGRQIRLEREENSNLHNLDGLSERIGVYTFSNPYGLQPTASSSFLETEISGEARAYTGRGEAACQVLTNTLEASAVDLSDEMINMLITQKAFQVNARVVQIADQLEEVLNNLR